MARPYTHIDLHTARLLLYFHEYQKRYEYKIK